MGGMAGALAARDAAFWNIDYRGLDSAGGGYPGTFRDMQVALDLIEAQALARKLDRHRLVLVGHSAGSVLALWAAGRAKLPPCSALHEALPLAVQQVVALGATADFRTSADEAYRTHCEIEPHGRLRGPEKCQ
jgi:acetyl esterase/lipase